MISSVEALRLSLERGAVTLALAATPEDEATGPSRSSGTSWSRNRTARPRTCGWCGRHDPPGDLADESMGGPPTYQCNDAEGCALARWEREPAWLASQVPGWEWQFRRHQAIEEQMNWLRSRAWAAYHPEQFALWREEVTPEFAYALSQVREMVDERAVPLAGDLRELRETLGLTAQTPTWPAAYGQPSQPPNFSRLCRDSSCIHTTMRCPDNRTHTLGHHRQQPRVTDAASAIARKAVRTSA